MPTPAAAALLEATALRKHYGGREVVRGLDLYVEAGRCYGLLGPNGAGKTTTLRLLLGQTPADGGRLRLFGRPVDLWSSHLRAGLGVVPQADNLDPDFTVEENLRVYGSYFGLRGRVLDERVARLLAFAALEERAATRIPQLSGGMKRRLTIARALINEPRLVVLDEPTTGLDPQARHLIWARLRGLRDAGTTLLLTTHYMEEAQRLCDWVWIMDQGRIVTGGPPAELIRRHVEPQVVELHGLDVRGLQALTAGLTCRCEPVGQGAYCYGAGLARLVARAERHGGLEVLQRPANLEDVFLRLTGRELRD